MKGLSPNVIERKKELEALINDYTKVLNSTVSVHFEIYDTSIVGGDELDPKIKEFVESSSKELLGKLQKAEEGVIDDINRVLSKQLSTEKGENRSFSEEGLLNYFNFLEDGNVKQWCFIRFSGFDRGVVSLFRETRNPFIKDTLKYSFLKFLMHNIFDELRNGKYYELRAGNKEEYISSKARDFMRDLLAVTSALNLSNDGKMYNDDLFDEFNYISTLNYEGVSISAKLLMLNEKEMDKHVNFYIKLKEPIGFEQHRRIRKLLETSDAQTFLIGDYEQIYGLGTLKDYEYLKQQPVFVIDFMGKFEYKISMLFVSRDIIISDREGIENVQWSLEEQTLLVIRYGTPNLRENRFSSLRLRDKLRNVFFYEENGMDDGKVNSIITLVKYAVEQRSGTTVVITKPELAEAELEKLEHQAIRIEKTNLLAKNTYELKNIMERITCIDGAVYLDSEGYCYAIGVILDGIAEKNQGDSARGARYNSAIRYVNKEGLKNNCVIVVISEDGMVDIVPDIKETEEMINRLINQLIEYVNKGQFEEALGMIRQTQFTNKPAKIYYYEGYIHVRLNNLTEGVKAYTRAIEIDNNYVDAYVGRGYVYTLQLPDKESEGIADCTKVLELDPKNIIAYINRAYIYNQSKKYEKAIIDCTKAIEIDPENITPYGFRGNAYIGLDTKDGYEKAIRDYTYIINENKASGYTYKARGDAYSNLQDYNKAIVDYDMAIKLQPEYQEAIDARNSILSPV
ncbi:tetratricopeptide repeat protein [Bacillus thuringiensis]|nr:tetratricopeptide repeat protein [Bacillus thuringiensis]ALQ70104.1 hypothetical protein ATN06_22895 [Bacillus thuringiensis]